MAITEAIKALVEIVNRKFDKNCTDIGEAIRYLTQDQPANLLQDDGEEKYEEDEDCILQVESSSESSISSNSSNSSDDSVSSSDDSGDSSKNKDGSKEKDDVSEAEEHKKEEQGEWAAKTAEDASKIDKEGEVEVTSPDDEAERKDGLKEEDDKEEEKEEGNKTPGGKDTPGKGARNTAS